MKIKLLISVVALFTSHVLTAQQDWESIEIKTTTVAPGFYMLEGAGGNIAVCTGNDGVLIVDTQYAPLSDKIKSAISALSDGPIRYVANTHFHGDHSGGNEKFAEDGATIIAHQNVKTRMSEVQKRPFGPETPAAPQLARPVVSFNDELELTFNDQQILMIHVDNAHTDGDAFIYFPEADIIHLGDTYFQKRYPYIDIHSGGTIDGMINAANTALFIAGKHTKIIPGHGKLSNARELKEYRDVLVHLRHEIAAAKKAGKTLEQVQEMKPGAETDEDWGGAYINPTRMVQLVYDSLPEDQ